MAKEKEDSNDLDIINDNNREDEHIHPLQHGCEDNWTWSKKHRSQEVILPEPTRRKGVIFRIFIGH